MAVTSRLKAILFADLEAGGVTVRVGGRSFWDVSIVSKVVFGMDKSVDTADRGPNTADRDGGIDGAEVGVVTKAGCGDTVTDGGEL